MKKPFARVVPVLLLLAGCEALTGTPDVNVRDEIDQKVWEANVPGITVYPNALAGTGIITLRG